MQVSFRTIQTSTGRKPVGGALRARAAVRPALRQGCAFLLGLAGGWAVLYGALMPFGLDHLLSRESDERSSRSRCFGQVKVSFSYCSILRALQKETSGKTKKRHPIAMAWGYSSVGRAPALQAGGQGFESLYLHHLG